MSPLKSFHVNPFHLFLPNLYLSTYEKLLQCLTRFININIITLRQAIISFKWTAFYDSSRRF